MSTSRDRIVIDAVDAQALERGREHPLGHQAVLDHVRHAGRRAQVVLEHAQHAVGAADQIDARDVDADAARRLEAAQARDVLARRRAPAPPGSRGRRGPSARRTDRRGTAAARVSRCTRPRSSARPLGGRDHPRHQAERQDLLGAALVGVDRKRHALLRQRQLRQRLRSGEGVGRHVGEDVRDDAGVVAGAAALFHQLVVRAVEGVIACEQLRGRGRRARWSASDRI